MEKWWTAALLTLTTILVMSKVLKVTPKTIAFDVALTALVWVLFALWFAPHVPTEDATIALLGGAFTAVPGAGTFWICLQMFKIVLAHQRQLAAEKRE